MKLKKRNIIWLSTLSIATLPLLMIYLTFTSSNDCDQMVIDTYELHSNINIPQVDYVNCYFDEKLNTRISIYDLKGLIDLKDFDVFTNSPDRYLEGIKLLPKHEQPEETTLYLASGERWGTKWTYAVDHKSNRLWAELNY